MYTRLPMISEDRNPRTQADTATTCVNTRGLACGL